MSKRVTRRFIVLIPRILSFSIGIAGRPYNSVGTTVLHCAGAAREAGAAAELAASRKEEKCAELDSH